MIYHTTISHTNSNVYLSQEERNKMQKRIRIEHTKEEQRKKLKNIEWKNEMYSSCAVVHDQFTYSVRSLMIFLLLFCTKECITRLLVYKMATKWLVTHIDTQQLRFVFLLNILKFCFFALILCAIFLFFFTFWVSSSSAHLIWNISFHFWWFTHGT